MFIGKKVSFIISVIKGHLATHAKIENFKMLNIFHGAWSFEQGYSVEDLHRKYLSYPYFHRLVTDYEQVLS